MYSMMKMYHLEKICVVTTFYGNQFTIDTCIFKMNIDYRNFELQAEPLEIEIIKNEKHKSC